MTKTRLSQKIDNTNPYQNIQPILPGQQAYPVQFEPLAHIRLSRSTYKVTTFIKFKPYIESFRKFQSYLETFLTDLTDSNKISAFRLLLTNKLTSVAQDLVTKIITKHNCETQTAIEACSGDAIRKGGTRQLSEATCTEEFQLICRAIDQFKTMANATMHIKSAFDQVKEQFLSVIDHLETEQDQPDEKARNEHNLKVETDIKIGFTRVSKEELEELETILKQVESKYPDVKENLKRHKRFGIMSWILGWGVYSNYRQVRAIKKNIRKLYLQNVLQEKQIQDLAHYLNLTATRVRLHDRMLYNIQLRLYRLDHCIRDLQDLVTFNWYVNNMLMDANVVVNRLITGLIVLRKNVEVIYRYLSVIASHEVNPVMIPPPPLRDLLEEVQEEMKQNPRLKLPYDPQDEIYKFYEVMKVTPVIVEDVLTMLLTIPLIDKSIEMNIYRVHNLPALQVKLGVAAEYVLEGDYLAVDQHGLYVALPDEKEMQISLTS